MLKRNSEQLSMVNSLTKNIVDQEPHDIKYFKSLEPIKVSEVYDTYWRFAQKRQEVFFNKLHRARYPWTDDIIIQKFKFTNVYRASDRVSQYLIKNIIYSGPKDIVNVVFRILLFKIFNKIETWELLEKNFGEITYQDYNYKQFNKILTEAINSNKRIYSAAYIMPPVRLDSSLKKKHSNHLKILELMMEDKIYEKVANTKIFKDVYDILIGYPLIGQFLAYQFSIDINYSEVINFSENDFVIPGPGALNGIKKCFISTGGLSTNDIIKFMKDRQFYEFERLGLDFRTLWGRPLTLIDCQNLFCEVDKYSRIAHPDIKGKDNRKKIKQMYKPNGKDITSYWFPPKWRINADTL
jgi:hypothetical protein